MSHIIKHFEEFDIAMSQSKGDSYFLENHCYTVQYGKQVKSNLNYEQACLELGSCLMHAFYCESLALDNNNHRDY